MGKEARALLISGVLRASEGDAHICGRAGEGRGTGTAQEDHRRGNGIVFVDGAVGVGRGRGRRDTTRESERDT